MAQPKDHSDYEKPLTSPYGPQHGHVDEAAGGADSSPFENDASEDRRDAAQEDQPPAQRDPDKRK